MKSPRRIPASTSRLLLALMASSSAALLVSSTASAATANWTGATGGIWATGTNWSTGIAPTSADDLTFLGPANVAGALTVNINAAAAAGSLNFTNTAATTLNNTTSGANQTLTLSGTGITTGTGAVTIGSGTANQNVNVALASSQTWDVGSGGLTATNVISGAFSLNKTGTGTLTMNAANSFSGGLTVSAGTVATNNNTGFGAANSTLTLGAGAADATLLFTGSPTGISQNIVVAAGAGNRYFTSSNATAYGANGLVTSSSNTITLNKDLIFANTANGNIQVRGTITGAFNVTADATNVGVIELRGANTFANLNINAGAVVSNTAVAGTVSAGALGTGTITLGQASSSTAATLGTNNSGGAINAITVTAGGARTIKMYSATTTSGTFSGAVTLGNDLTLQAVATTLTTGADRLRFGSGGITGSNNIIIDNSNTATGAVASSGAIRLDGSASATAWSGNLIVQTGQGSLGSNNAIGSANTVGVASGALFNFSGNGSLAPTIAGLANATSGGALGGSTGGTVYHSQAANLTLSLGGSGTYTFDGAITNALNGTNTTAITKSGSGTQTLNGTNTYTGATAINAGTLLVNGSLTSAVTVNAGSFGGAGSSSAAITIGNSTGTSDSFFAAGNAGVGTFTTTGAVTMNSDAVFSVQFNSDSASFDKIVASGLTLNASSSLVLADLGTTTLGLGVSYTIFDNTGGSSIAGTFAGLSEGSTLTAGSNTFIISYVGGTGNNDIVLTTSAIPEPATYAVLAGLGVLGLAAYRRRPAA